MTNEEAKFMLQGYRPNGADAENTAFAEALAQANRDPMLRNWFEREQAFDTVVAGKLSEVMPPAGLRDSILAGTRISSPAETPRRSWWAQPWGMVLATAAAVAVLFAVILNRPGQPIAVVPGVESILRVALADYRGEHPMGGKHADMLGGFGAWLENSASRLGSAPASTDFAALKADGCRSINVAGREVLEICFQRETGWYHVYVSPREGFDDGSLHREPMFHEQGEFVAASWADEKFVYLLASNTGVEALRGLL